MNKIKAAIVALLSLVLFSCNMVGPVYAATNNVYSSIPSGTPCFVRAGEVVIVNRTSVTALKSYNDHVYIYSGATSMVDIRFGSDKEAKDWMLRVFLQLPCL